MSPITGTSTGVQTQASRVSLRPDLKFTNFGNGWATLQNAGVAAAGPFWITV